MSLEVAIRYAKKNPITRQGRSGMSRHGAFLTDGHSHFIGWNDYKSHPLQARFNPDVPEKICTHAEISAIARAVSAGVSDFDGYTMYVARVTADGEPGLARPCPGCWRALIEFGINEVEWTV